MRSALSNTFTCTLYLHGLEQFVAQTFNPMAQESRKLMVMTLKGLVLCVCQGTCPSFQKMNVFEVANHFRRTGSVDFVVIHPQLCAVDGDNFWRVLLKGVQDEIDTLVVAGCAPEMQKKLFRDAFRSVGFNEAKHVGVDIRNMTTEEAVKAIEQILGKK